MKTENKLHMDETPKEIITEIAPIQSKHGFYIVERDKTTFDYPVHCHEAYEINFLYGCKGARRIVGDSIVELDDFDLVLVGHGIEHGWEQHNCRSTNIREFTMQFSKFFFYEDYLRDNNLSIIIKLLNLSANGIAFGTRTVLKSFATIEKLPKISDPMESMFTLMQLIKMLAESDDYTILSTSTFTSAIETNDSRRITKAQNYIRQKITERISLTDLSALIGMTESSFSRFFKLRTGTSVSDYIMNLRLGVATRKLVDTQMTISEICYECGFNNVSHFCRCFRLKKSCSPTEFRKMYHKSLTR